VKAKGEGEERLKMPHWKLKIDIGNTGYWQHFPSSHGEKREIFQTTKYTKNTKAGGTGNRERGIANVIVLPLPMMPIINFRSSLSLTTLVMKTDIGNTGYR
jgi:hypothetical protein